MTPEPIARLPPLTHVTPRSSTLCAVDHCWPRTPPQVARKHAAPRATIHAARTQVLQYRAGLKAGPLVMTPEFHPQVAVAPTTTLPVDHTSTRLSAAHPARRAGEILTLGPGSVVNAEKIFLNEPSAVTITVFAPFLDDFEPPTDEGAPAAASAAEPDPAAPPAPGLGALLWAVPAARFRELVASRADLAAGLAQRLAGELGAAQREAEVREPAWQRGELWRVRRGPGRQGWAARFRQGGSG